MTGAVTVRSTRFDGADCAGGEAGEGRDETIANHVESFAPARLADATDTANDPLRGQTHDAPNDSSSGRTDRRRSDHVRDRDRRRTVPRLLSPARRRVLFAA